MLEINYVLVHEKPKSGFASQKIRTPEQGKMNDLLSPIVAPYAIRHASTIVLCDVHQTAIYVNNPLSRRFEICCLTKCMHGNVF